MSIKILNNIDHKIVSTDKLQIGETGVIINNPSYCGHVILKTCSGLVSLTDPHTWTGRILSFDVIPVDIEMKICTK